MVLSATVILNDVSLDVNSSLSRSLCLFIKWCSITTICQCTHCSLSGACTRSYLDHRSDSSFSSLQHKSRSLSHCVWLYWSTLQWNIYNYQWLYYSHINHDHLHITYSTESSYCSSSTKHETTSRTKTGSASISSSLCSNHRLYYLDNSMDDLHYVYNAVSLRIPNKSIDRLAIEQFLLSITGTLNVFFPTASFYLYTLTSDIFRKEFLIMVSWITSIDFNRFNYTFISKYKMPALFWEFL